jgi:hypothetical protein
MLQVSVEDAEKLQSTAEPDKPDAHPAAADAKGPQQIKSMSTPAELFIEIVIGPELAICR